MQIKVELLSTRSTWPAPHRGHLYFAFLGAVCTMVKRIQQTQKSSSSSGADLSPTAFNFLVIGIFFLQEPHSKTIAFTPSKVFRLNAVVVSPAFLQCGQV